MKANDLMIGDWVYNPFTRKTLRLTFGRDLDLVEGLCLEPIPLTGEILEKNGFKKDVRNENYYKWNWYIIEDNASYDMETGMVRIFKASDLTFCHPIGYVHELQHALRLCGVEKDIIL